MGGGEVEPKDVTLRAQVNERLDHLAMIQLHTALLIENVRCASRSWSVLSVSGGKVGEQRYGFSNHRDGHCDGFSNSRGGNVASSVYWRRATGSVAFAKSSKTGAVKLAKSSEVGPVKNCERGTGQSTDSKHKAELMQEQKQIDRDEDGQRKNQVRRAGIC